LYQQALSLQEHVGDKDVIAWSLHGLGTIAQHQGDLGSALSYLERSRALFQEVGSRRGIASSLNRLGSIALDQGDGASARGYCQQGLCLFAELGHKGGMAAALENLATIAVAQNESGCGACLLGVAEALRKESQTPLPPSERSRYESRMTRL